MTETDSSQEAQIKALIEAEVTRAMAPYRALRLPAEVLAELETMLRLGLRTHPYAQSLLRQLASDPAVYESNEVRVRDLYPGGEEAKKETKT